jgi:hypothetical protein
MTYELPAFATRTSDESLQAYGARIFCFVLAHGYTAALSTEDLELAIHISIIAVATPDLSDLVRQKYTDARSLCARVVARRHAETAAAKAAVPAVEPNKPNIGPMAKLTPVPVNQPPAPALARPDIQF